MNAGSPGIHEELVREFYLDPVLAMRSLFPEWFPSKMPWIHRGLVALVLKRTDFLTKFGEELWQDGIDSWTRPDLDALVTWFTFIPEGGGAAQPLFEVEETPTGPVVHMTTSRFLQVMIPRGFSKTTLFNALMILLILYREERYLVYLSETSTHAEMQLQNVKRELEQNETILALYGKLAPERNDPQKWTGTVIETLSGVTVQATGRGGQVRGKNVSGRRPGVILIDDVEDTESVLTPEQREKTFKWLMKDVKPALPRRKGNIYILGTLLHAESMMMRVMNDPDWVSIRFGSMLKDGSPLWRRHMNEKEWLATRTSYARSGLLSDFYMEYQSSIHVDADSRRFRIEDMRIQVMTRTEFVLVSQACDPAISDKAGADSFVIAVAGKTARGLNHVLDIWSGRGVHPRDQIEKFFEMHFKWLPDIHGVEAIAYQRALLGMLTEEMAHKAIVYGSSAFFEVLPITHGLTAKEVRIEGVLAPRYRAGYITHQRFFENLIAEAIDWPNGKKDNLDAVAMAINLLNPGTTLPAPNDLSVIDGVSYRELAEDWAQQCP